MTRCTPAETGGHADRPAARSSRPDQAAARAATTGPPDPTGGGDARRIPRRSLLRAVGAGALAMPALGACGRPHTVNVVVALSGTELRTFQKLVAGFDGGPVNIVVASGNGVDAMVRARLRAGNPPDVAVFSEPGLAYRYADEGWLEPLTPPEAPRRSRPEVTPPYWTGLASHRIEDGPAQQYGYWLKAAHKSLFWYVPDRRDPVPVPHTWSELSGLAAGWDRPTPLLSIAAADGWVLTDWFENLLAAIAPPAQFEDLARGVGQWRSNSVRQALRELGGLWHRLALPGGPQRALLTSFDASVVDVFGTRRATMLFEGDFVKPVADGLGTPPDLGNVFRFPSYGGRTPLLVGGDLAVLFRRRRYGDPSPTAERFMHYLHSGRARRVWARAGFLVPATDVPLSTYTRPLDRALAAEITAPDAAPLFDLSDRLTGALAGDDGKGSWRIMQDFFRQVTRHGAGVVEEAVDAASDAFARSAGPDA